jgi:hypothetical protein
MTTSVACAVLAVMMTVASAAVRTVCRAQICSRRGVLCAGGESRAVVHDAIVVGAGSIVTAVPVARDARVG